MINSKNIQLRLLAGFLVVAGTTLMPISNAQAHCSFFHTIHCEDSGFEMKTTINDDENMLTSVVYNPDKMGNNIFSKKMTFQENIYNNHNNSVSINTFSNSQSKKSH